LNDHRIDRLVVVPAVIYLEMALAAFPSHARMLEDVIVQEPLILSEDEQERTAQLIVKEDGSFQVFSCAADDPDNWRLHASGKIVQHLSAPSATIPPAMRSKKRAD